MKEAADGLGKADMGLHLPPLRPPRELPAELHELGDPGCGQRVPARLEPAGGVHGQAPPLAKRTADMMGQLSQCGPNHG
jgi:hypothetical protein